MLLSTIGFSLVLWVDRSQANVPQIRSQAARDIRLDVKSGTLIAQAETSSQAEADRLYKQGVTQVDRGDNAVALVSLQTALKLYQQLNDRPGQMNAIRYMGWAQYQLKDYPKALEQFQQSLTIAQAITNRSGEAKALNGLGSVYESVEKRDKALANYEQAQTIAIDTKDQELVATISENLGGLFEYSDFSKAYTPFQTSLKIWRDLKQPKKEASLLLRIGNFYARWPSNCSRAIDEAYKPSLLLFRQLNDRASEGIALGGIGRCYIENKTKDAITYLNQSLAIAREFKNRRNESIVLADLAKAYQALDEVANNRWENGLLLTDFSQPIISTEQSTKALQSAQQSSAIAQELKYRSGEAAALQSLGRTYAVLGQLPKAIAAQNQRLMIAREFQNTVMEAEVLTHLGTLYTSIGDHRQAIAQHQAAIGIYQADWQRREANLKASNIPITTALRGYEYRLALMYLGDNYRSSGDYERAIQAYQTASKSPEELRKSAGSIDISLLRRLGYTLAQAGNLAEAATTIQLAIDTEEIFRTGLGYGSGSSGWKPTDSDRIKFAERQAADYRQLQQVLVGQKRNGEALEIAEAGRARTFVELLSARTAGNPLGEKLPPPPKLNEIRQVAKTQNATLVQYSIVGPDLLYIWVIKPSGEIIFRSTKLKTTQSLAQLVASSRSEIGVRGRSEIKRESSASDTDRTSSDLGDLAKLHQILIDPIAQDLPTEPNQRVIFLPQGELFLVPFAALPNAQGQYLIQRHTIVTAPSIQTLEFTHAQAKQARSEQAQFKGRSVVVGDPKMPLFNGIALPPLPGARQEAIVVAKLLNTTPLLGEQATKSAVLAQMQSASVIHLATHGLLDTVQGDVPGAIALAPSGQDNGLLSASEIFDLKLNANLVVLSACDTGRGKITGDGVLGLSRSIVAAGVPTVLVSLWAVNDASTSVLMSEFYRQLEQQQYKAQALRQAMLITMQKYPQPEYWAAFTLVGETVS